jgi:hypothetical protein
MMQAGNKIAARDDKLLRNEKSWRRARVGAIGLLIVWAGVTFALFRSSDVLEREREVGFAVVGWVLFWIVVIDWLNLRLAHIESIKYYRSQLKGGMAMEGRDRKDW